MLSNTGHLETLAPSQHPKIELLFSPRVQVGLLDYHSKLFQLDSPHILLLIQLFNMLNLNRF